MGRAAATTVRERLLGGWALVPILSILFLNVRSERIFEPDRSAVVRMLVIALVGAELVRVVVCWGGVGRPWQDATLSAVRTWIWRRPLVVCTLGFVCTLVLSTALALDPRQALMGSYERGLGAGLEIAAIVAAIALAYRAHRVQRVHSILAAVQFGGLVASVVAVAQYLELSTFPTQSSIVDRSIGTLGNPVFLGAVLAICLPLALAMALTELPDEAAGDAERGGTQRRLAAGAMAVGSAVLAVLGLQTAVAHRATPGSTVMWLATIVVAAVLWLQATGGNLGARASSTWSIVGIAAAVVLAVADRAIPGEATGIGPGAAWWSVLGAVAFGCAYTTSAAGTAAHGPSWARRSRAVTWLPAAGWLGVALVEGVALVATGSRGPLVGASAGVVAFVVAARLVPGGGTRARLLTGCGLGVATISIGAAFWVGGVRGQGPLDFATGTGLERRLIWTGDGSGGGVAGVLAAGPLWRLVVGYGAESLPLLFERQYPVTLGLLLRFAVPDRSHMVPLDVLLHHGLLGLGAWLACGALACRSYWRLAHRGNADDRAVKLLACGLLGGTVAHLVEGVTGIEVVATSVLWWLLVALADVLPRSREADETSSPVARPTPAVAGALTARARLLTVTVGLAVVAVVVVGASAQAQTVLADVQLATARTVEQAAALSGSAEGRRATVLAYAGAIQRSPTEAELARQYGDALWRMASRGPRDPTVPTTGPVAAPEPAPDPAGVADIAARADVDGLLLASEAAYQSAHRLRPERSDLLGMLARVAVARYQLSGDPERLREARARLEEATALLPTQVYLMANEADVLLALAGRDVEAGRVESAGSYLDEADRVLRRAFALGASRQIELNARLDTVFRLRDAVK